ncbi:hypothetical protein F5887DRAFT_236181 [Amanita rubescens]|nr:hypothetical protein F5887DRAFT_236181 [Amanita rubescens]
MVKLVIIPLIQLVLLAQISLAAPVNKPDGTNPTPQTLEHPYQRIEPSTPGVKGKFKNLVDKIRQPVRTKLEKSHQPTGEQLGEENPSRPLLSSEGN